jgi:hypothetical protein
MSSEINKHWCRFNAQTGSQFLATFAELFISALPKRNDRNNCFKRPHCRTFLVALAIASTNARRVATRQFSCSYFSASFSDI